MSASNSLENGIHLLLFNNDAFAGIGDAGGLQPSAVDGSLYVSLHTGDPGEGGNQTTSEADYTSYARVAVARTVGGWTVAAANATNAAAVTFPKCTGGSNTITYAGIGTAAAGAGILLWSGALSSSLAVSNNITPKFDAGEIDVDVD